MTKKFDQPLNQWIEEEVEVPQMVPKVNQKEKRIEFEQKKVKATQKTFYASSPKKKMICAKGTHYFACINRGKYIFKCHNCDYHKIAYPVTFKFDPDTGVLAYRDSGIRV